MPKRFEVRLDDLRRNYIFSSALLFCLAALTGWSVFNLQVISLVRLLEGVGIEFLPGMMLVQAGFSWVLLHLWGSSARGSPRKFYFTALLGGCAIAFGGHPKVLEGFAQILGEYRGWAFGAMFIFSQLVISALRMGIHVTFSKRVSVLSNPQISTQLAISEEAGSMLGVLIALSGLSQFGWTSYAIAAAPFFVGMIVFGVLGSERKRKTETELVSESTPSVLGNQNKRMPSFFGWMTALFAMVASLKALQWFGMAYGLSEASRQGLHVMSLFSHLTLIQSVLTLGILAASLKFSSRIPTWGLGFKVLLTAQSVGAAGLAFFPTPYVLMGGETIRKVLERGFLGRSLQLLTSTLPDEQRFESRHFMELWSTTSGTLIAGIFAFLTVHGYLPMSLLWASMIGLGLVGLYFRRRLFDSLCDFYVARLRQNRLEGVLQACHVLGNPDCRYHHAALTSLLERNPRPIVKKGILRALGRMQHSPVVPAILCHLQSDREDIQLAAVRAVNNYKGHDINFVLLKELREMVRSVQPMRISVVHCITERLDRLVIPYLVEVLESEPDERVAANAIEILGEVAIADKDQDLMDYVAKFLDTKYPRRVRANAVVVLYRNKRHGMKALETFDRFLTSDDHKELDASAYIAGVVGLRGHESYIWERSESVNHSNITCLVALLRLGNPRAPKLLGAWISGEDENKSREALIRLSVLQPRVRARVFYEIIENNPDSLNLIFARMRKSQRDLESDRELIREEVQRLGLRFVEEDAWTQSIKEAA